MALEVCTQRNDKEITVVAIKDAPYFGKIFFS